MSEPDLQETINALELIRRRLLESSGYIDSFVVGDAITLLKAQQEQIDQLQARLVDYCPCLALDGDGSCPLPDCIGKLPGPQTGDRE